jgi:hypothetical protein
MPLFGKINPRITWNKNPETDVAGYVIFIGLESGNYNLPNQDVGLTLDLNNPGHTFSTLHLTNIQRWHYFVVRAYDASGNMSPNSAEVKYYVSDPYTREVVSKVLAKRG